jgi:hypothetical protein
MLLTQLFFVAQSDPATKSSFAERQRPRRHVPTHRNRYGGQHEL